MSDAVVEILERARNLYANNPSHAALSQPIEPGCYCVITAFSCAADNLGDRWVSEFEALDIFREATKLGPSVDLVHWNSKKSTEEVVAVFDRAIAPFQGA